MAKPVTITDLSPLLQQLYDAICLHANTLRTPLSVGGKVLDILTVQPALSGPWPAIGEFEDQKAVDTAVGELVTLGLVTFDDHARLFPVRFAKAPTDREIVANVAKAAEAGQPIRFLHGDSVMSELISAGRVLMCLQPQLGSLDVPGGPYSAFAICEQVEAA